MMIKNKIYTNITKFIYDHIWEITERELAKKICFGTTIEIRLFKRDIERQLLND